MNINDVKIKIFLAKAKTETLAYVAIEIPLEIDGIIAPLSISNFRIMTSHYGQKNYKVLPPAIYSNGKYKDIFFLKNPELWHKLEGLILNEYQKLADRIIFDRPNDTS